MRCRLQDTNYTGLPRNRDYMGYTAQDLYEALGKIIVDGHGDSSAKTTDQDGNEGDVLGVLVNDLGIVEIEIA